MATRRRGEKRRFRVSVAGGFVIARSTSLPFVVAHARALALRGYCAFIADQLGRERTLIVGWLWYAACYAGFAVARVPAHFWILFAAYGLVAALTEGTERAMVADAVPPETRGRALGIYNLVTGVGLVAASVLAGQIWERASPTAALLFGAFLAFGASAVLRFGPRPGERAPVA